MQRVRVGGDARSTFGSVDHFYLCKVGGTFLNMDNVKGWDRRERVCLMKYAEDPNYHANQLTS